MRGKSVEVVKDGRLRHMEEPMFWMGDKLRMEEPMLFEWRQSVIQIVEEECSRGK